jgi:hypothetical protein
VGIACQNHDLVGIAHPTDTIKNKKLGMLYTPNSGN